MALSPAVIEFFEKEAEDALAHFDGDPDMFEEQDAKDAISYAGTLEHLITIYCSMPDQAGSQVHDFLSRLPRYSDAIGDAFFALATLVSTRDCLRKIVGEDHYLAMEQRRGNGPKTDLSAAKGSPSQSDIDKDIGRSAQQKDTNGRGITDNDIEQSAWGQSNTRDLEQQIRTSAQDDSHRGDNEERDYRNLDPVSCFRHATFDLVVGILVNCVKTADAQGNVNPRMEKLAEHLIITAGKARSIVQEVQHLQTLLKPPAAGTQRAH